MKLTKEEQRAVLRLLMQYLNTDPASSMKYFIQHGSISTRTHCFNVTCASYWISKRFNIPVDERALVAGAFLHDLFLYDWHGRSLRFCNHGFTHPGLAKENAVHYYSVDEKVQNIIRSHMWPMTVFHMPRCKEAWIVMVADKIVSFEETCFKR